MQSLGHKYICCFFFFVVFFLSGNISKLWAQRIDVKGRVEIVGKNTERKKIYTPAGGCFIFWFNTKEDAREFKKKYPKRPEGGQTIDANYIQTNEDGSFSLTMLVGGSIIVYHPDTKDKPEICDIMSKHHNELLSIQFEDNGGYTLGETVVKGKRKQLPTPQPKKARVFGDKCSWTCVFPIPEGYGRKDGRLIIQPYAMDCQSEDTVACLTPLVLEGNEYHNLQDRRKGFRYNPNDPLCTYYDTLCSLTDTNSVSITRYFIRPDVNKLYYCTGDELFGDYTHVYHEDIGFVFGSCYVSQPFKFLDMNFGYNDIPLDKDEFYERPTNRLIEQHRDLQLKFVVGKADLTQDSINIKTMDQLVQELKSYGNLLAQVTIIGCASPDGRLETNMSLARKRAELSRSILLKYVNSRKVQIPPVETKVYTWDDVADSLDMRGYSEEAVAIRNASNPSAAYSVAKSLPIYTEIIGQILDNQRIMKCSYMYSQKGLLEPEEAVRYYYTNPDFQPGGSEIFTNGDYFNLLTLIKEPAEQRKIVERAYKENISRSGFKYNAFAAYLANRMALYAIADGVPDTILLKPFIDLGCSGCDLSRSISFMESSTWKVNRRQIMANQAIMYLKAGFSNYAEMYIGFLPDTSSVKSEMKHYLNMIDYFMQFDDENCDEEIKRRGEEGLIHVMNTNPKNKAILTAELHEELNIKIEDALALVDSLLSDDDAVKWYLKGMLMSGMAGVEPVPGDGFVKLTDAEENALIASDYPKYLEYLELEEIHEQRLKDFKDGNETPHFLAYFQHCFDMNLKYEKYYATEGNIAKSIFEKYPYKKSDIELYRKKFDKLMTFGKNAKNAEVESETETDEQVINKEEKE